MRAAGVVQARMRAHALTFLALVHLGGAAMMKRLTLRWHGIARAMAIEPRVLLMDERFSALGQMARDRICAESFLSSLTKRAQKGHRGAQLAKHSVVSRIFSPSVAKGVKLMRREELTEKILDIKREKGLTWTQITEDIGGISPVLVVGALLGQMKLVKPLARRAAALFNLSESEERMLNEVPHRGAPMPPTDPLIYRFYELVMVNGPAWKALIEEEFGDGIMSAIDFDMEIERLPNPKGDRVKITMSGKFLPYKYYGNEQGVQDYGLKEV
jgi:cyanate lyase